MDMMCADMWHHSEDIKAYMQQQDSPESTKKSKSPKYQLVNTCCGLRWLCMFLCYDINRNIRIKRDNWLKAFRVHTQ